MWKHGFQIAENTQQHRPMLVEFRAFFRFEAYLLYRKCGGAAPVYVYILKSDGYREVVSMFYAQSYFWFGNDQIFLEPGEKLIIATSGMKKKENAFLMESVSGILHGEDDELKRYDKQFRIVRGPEIKPIESYRHKVHQPRRKKDAALIT